MGDFDIDESWPRRRFLGTVAGVSLAVGAAGCSGDGLEPATVELVELTTRVSGEETQLLANEEVTIDPGNFHGWEFSLDQQGEIEFTVELQDGPEVDVYILTNEEYEMMQNQEDYFAIADSVYMSVNQASGSVSLPEGGTYWLIIMNADVAPVNS